MSLPRVLITGGNGLLGTKVIAELLRTGWGEPVSLSAGPRANGFLGTFEFHQADVADPIAVARVVQGVQPRAVVHTAALTDVDGCERRPADAWRVNAEGTVSVARAARAVGARLVYLSTEYVFDGRAGPYHEDDPVNPLGQYARTKLAGELAVQALCDDWAIARTTVLYGWAPNARPNFVTWLLGKLRAGERVRVVRDQIGSPTLADNLAEMVIALALSDRIGVYHTVGASVIGRCDFARLAARVFELDPTLIDPIATAELRQPAARPLQAGLRVDKFQRDFPAVPVLTAEAGLLELRRESSLAARP